ncbi:MAG TPA: lipocalin family protein [Pseudomonadales bacterium]|nr:lipocalin family protein [Pseudomonadales bacterium]
MTKTLCTGLMLMLLCACQNRSLPPMTTVAYVDLERFMGDWYVIAAIPTSFEAGAHDAVESYARTDDYIATTFRFRRGSHDGPEKTLHAKGYVRDTTTNARWGMQFVWPFRADYRVILLDADYRTTIIGREARDYVWIMAREPHLDAATLAGYRDWLAGLGYDVDKLVIVPQRSGAPTP